MSKISTIETLIENATLAENDCLVLVRNGMTETEYLAVFNSEVAARKEEALEYLLAAQRLAHSGEGSFSPEFLQDLDSRVEATKREALLARRLADYYVDQLFD